MLVSTEYRLSWQFKTVEQNISKSLFTKNNHFVSTVEPLLYDHPQNHIGVVV